MPNIPTEETPSLQESRSEAGRAKERGKGRERATQVNLEKKEMKPASKE